MKKPQLDDREYRLIVLPNKLQALLVCDPLTDKASAAVDVSVGTHRDLNLTLTLRFRVFQ